MEKIVRLPLTTLAIALTIAVPAAAEPAKSGPARPAPAQAQPAEVVLASAESVHAPAGPSAQPAATPAKRPAPRLTTCRCGGDPQAEPDSQEQ
jgi:hypothetical protein